MDVLSSLAALYYIKHFKPCHRVPLKKKNECKMMEKKIVDNTY